LKLVHLRRLLPIEEVLSQFPARGGTGQRQTNASAKSADASATASASGGAASAAARVLSSGPVVAAKPAFSPFEQDRDRRRFDGRVGETAPGVVPSAPAVSAQMKQPVEAIATVATPVVSLVAATLAEAVGADLPPSSSPSAEVLQKAAVKALISAKSQETAADAMADAEWSVAEGEVRVQTEISKTMLPMVINADAEKLIKAALRDAAAGALKLVLVPGMKAAAATKKPKAVKTGSARAMAMEHPIVQRAQTLFNAEIQSVIDLRDND